GDEHGLSTRGLVMDPPAEFAHGVLGALALADEALAIQLVHLQSFDLKVVRYGTELRVEGRPRRRAAEGLTIEPARDDDADGQHGVAAWDGAVRLDVRGEIHIHRGSTLLRARS